MDEDSLESSDCNRERPLKVQRKRKTGGASSSDDNGESSASQIMRVRYCPLFCTVRLNVG